MKTKEIVEEYISYRKALGERFRTQSQTLETFCKFMGNDTYLHQIDVKDISNYLYSPTGNVTANWFSKYSILKGLYQWALPRGYVNDIPLPQDFPKRPGHIIPYIYNKDELARLFLYAATYTRNYRNINPYVIRAILMMTYMLGLRIHETVSLKLIDINLEESLVIVRESKFYKSRMVPFNEQVKMWFRKYLEWRKAYGHSQDPKSELFQDDYSNPIKTSAVRGRFERIREKAGVKRNDGATYQPRIQDLRHTFSVNRLTSWYKEGKNVQILLPVLSTYLGHSKLSHTSVYLTMTEDLLKEASKRFEKYAGHE